MGKNTTEDEQTQIWNEFAEEANEFFSKISPEINNGDLLKKTVDLEGVSQRIVEMLGDIERHSTGSGVFGDDKTLTDWFESQEKKGAIVMPKDPVEKLRWQALICLAASNKENFSHGNVLIVPDYLPEGSEEFKEFENRYGTGVLDDIIAIRDSLRKNSSPKSSD